MPQLPPGLMVIHGNRMESLRELAIAWIGQHPLPPLANETILVQSNGVAQWLKLALAASPEKGGLGISAAVDVQLPSRFLWQAYRAVLGRGQVPKHSPYDKERLLWRLMRLLPSLADASPFAPLAAYLKADADQRKRHQLAGRLADLFDQYQVYRADWLAAWAAGRDVLPDGRGGEKTLPRDQAWQPMLWRALVADIGGDGTSRAGVHERFLAQAVRLEQRPAGLPERLMVFGLSSLPAQSLEALAVLARFCQVLVFVLNPCRHYWADVVPQRELLRIAHRRQAAKPGMPADIPDEDLHLFAQPLLAAWGRQGRDYIRLLDEYDQPETCQRLIAESGLPLPLRKLELFEAPEKARLLGQLQDDILELRPLLETRKEWPALAPADHSIAFHVAHGPLREVEILHDRLLARFDADPSLKPRDVIVMVPDIEGYAPFVVAAFGQYGRDDFRHIPYTLADRRQRGREPLLAALEFILSAPECRFPASGVLDLLDVPAVRKRFGVSEPDLPVLHRWVRQAGVRWGLSAEQRAGLGLPEGLEQNTWRFGLARMLLGYGAGEGRAWRGVEPYGEIAGLDAAALGPLALLLQRLEQAGERLSRVATPEEWGHRLREVLWAFFLASSEEDSLLLARLENGLDEWQEACKDGGLTEPLPLAVVRETWLSGLDAAGLSQRFMGGAVNFCTLMPMRAIPFRVVCLLGMNDGDYPRSQPASDFDLMAKDYRPGDRSRREDDRYLFLEAILSARDHLYLSWVGRSPRDNSERPPSVLIGQLRDHLKAGWQLADGADLLARLTTEHFLQPFNPACFGAPSVLGPGREPGYEPDREGGPHFSYAREWLARGSGDGNEESGMAEGLGPLEPLPVLTLAMLGAFLKNPVKGFFNHRLKVWFGDDGEPLSDWEPFSLDRLEESSIGDDLLAAALPFAGDEARVSRALEERGKALRRQGRLPLAGMGQALLEELTGPFPVMLGRYGAMLAAWPDVVQESLRLEFSRGRLRLEDVLSGLRADAGRRARILPLARPLFKGKSPNWRQLLGPWVAHLAAAACGLEVTTVLVGTDRNLTWEPLPEERAQECLADLLESWLEGMSRPLPLALSAGFAWLNKGEGAARNAYEGADYARAPGEASYCPYLTRQYPDFDALSESGEFPEWAERLYRPLLDALSSGQEDGP